MVEDDRVRFATAIGSCALIYSKDINIELITVLWKVLIDQDIADVEQAILSHCKTSKFFPVPADIIGLIPQTRRQNIPLLHNQEPVPMSHRKVLR